MHRNGAMMRLFCPTGQVISKIQQYAAIVASRWICDRRLLCMGLFFEFLF